MKDEHKKRILDNLVSKEEIAEELGLSPKTIANWMSSGKIPCIKIGRKNYALVSELKRWLEIERRNG